MAFQTAVCNDDVRRALVRDLANPLNGIDFLEVSTDQKTLRVFFLKPVPLGAFGLPAAPQNVEVLGGVRVRDIKVVEVRRAGDNFLEVDVDHEGDFSTYTLILHSASLDPVFAQVDFSFKAGCVSRFDCKPAPCPTELDDDPPIDYLAKDYSSFRQALLDFISARIPGWSERHPTDVGIMLLELLAYAGDQLSYFQDSVSNEAFLRTALQRISVRRHARLVDYHVHDGAAARTFVQFEVASAIKPLPAGTQILARIDKRLGPNSPPYPPVLELVGDLQTAALQATPAIFETFQAINLLPDLNEIPIHTWRDRECCFPVGATSADLAGDLTAILPVGAYLLFEETKGPTTGLPEDADPNHRQIVRLTEVQLTQDPIGPAPVTRVFWDQADGLTFPLCISAIPSGALAPVVIAVARGNLVFADHGRTIGPEFFPEDPSNPGAQGIETGSRAFRFSLQEGPLTFRIPYDPSLPVADLLVTNPADALGQVTSLTVQNTVVEPGWIPVPDLFSSGPFDSNFVIETGNDGVALLRFGDNLNGESPINGSFIQVEYRIGNGTAGNIGREGLAHIIDLGGEFASITRIRNPIAAWGGTEPESVDRVKQLAPTAFRAEQFRAVTEADYAAAAEKHPRVSKAQARFRWTGSWLTVFIAIDPKGGFELDDDLKQSILNWVTRFTLAGYDLEIRPPVFAALDLEIQVCVQADHFRANVEAAVLEALSSRALPGKRLGFFHPDRFTFGQRLYLSQLIAAVQAVEGVSSVTVERFRRFDQIDDPPLFPATTGNIDKGYIPAQPTEILRMDNDANFPENGSLQLIMAGGK